MRVSIVIPTFNCEKYIVFAVESCINQNYKDIEIIIIDDGSTDNTGLKLFDSGLFSDDRIRYCCLRENSGRSFARNFGAEISSGDIITFLDADDIYKNFYIENIINEYYLMPGLDFLYVPPIFFDGESNSFCEHKSKLVGEASILIFSGKMPYTSGMSFRRESWAEIGGFNQSMEEREDWSLALEALNKKITISVKNIKGVVVRLHAASNSRNDKNFIKNTFVAGEQAFHITYRHEIYRKYRSDISYHIANTVISRNSDFFLKIRALLILFKHFSFNRYACKSFYLLIKCMVPYNLKIIIKRMFF